MQRLILNDERLPYSNLDIVLDILRIPILGCGSAKYVYFRAPFVCRGFSGGPTRFPMLNMLLRFRHLTTLVLDTELVDENEEFWWRHFLRAIFFMTKPTGGPIFDNVRIDSTVNIRSEEIVSMFVNFHEHHVRLHRDQRNDLARQPRIVHVVRCASGESSRDFVERLRRRKFVCFVLLVQCSFVTYRRL